MSSPSPDPAALAALHRAFSAKSEALEALHGLSAAPGASTQPAQPGSGLARVVQRLARGQQVVLHVVGGSAAAGAGGVGVNHTFDARLVAAFNSVLEQAEEGGTRRLGRLKRSNVAQGGTSSFWAGLVGEALHGTRPSLVLWEYAINDHSVALDAVQKVGGSSLSTEAASEAATQTMRYLAEAWLRRLHALRAPPALLLAYLWDKQPSAPFKPGNRQLCRRMPVPGSAFEAQAAVVRHYQAQQADVSALNAAAYVSHARRGAFCPLVADGYYHPSPSGHQLVSELLLLLLARQLAPLLSQPAAALGAAASRARPEGRATRAAEAGGAPSAAAAPLVRAAPCLLGGGAAGDACAVSDAVGGLLAEPGVRLSVRMAWLPQAAGADAPSDAELLIRGEAPPRRTFAAKVAERQDRKQMWVLPPCGPAASPLELRLPRVAGRRLRALSVFAAVSPGGEIRHSLDGRPIAFEQASGSFLQRSWGYVASWYLLARDANASAAPPPAVWSMCNHVRHGVRCVGYRCGLEFKMPMRTAAVGWAVAVTSRKKGRDVSST